MAVNIGSLGRSSTRKIPAYNCSDALNETLLDCRSFPPRRHEAEDPRHKRVIIALFLTMGCK